ncbi:MAG: DUF924 domain-containing protein [Proteobacteria bacterium]|nr:DUF924 domain-containing protein [Pseudomonadota bacterium]
MIEKTLEPLAQGILDFWFGPLGNAGEVTSSRQEQWFAKNPEFDASIKRRYEDCIDAAFMGGLDRWTLHPESLVALIVLLDQFSRNMFRGTDRAFAYDKKALAIALPAIRSGDYLKAPTVHGYFMLMPTMHCEFLDIQEEGLSAFKQLLTRTEPTNKSLIVNACRYAEAHRDIIARFGRFPHRNSIVGRVSSPEEQQFLQEPGSSF